MIYLQLIMFVLFMDDSILIILLIVHLLTQYHCFLNITIISHFLFIIRKAYLIYFLIYSSHFLMNLTSHSFMMTNHEVLFFIRALCHGNLCYLDLKFITWLFVSSYHTIWQQRRFFNFSCNFRNMLIFLSLRLPLLIKRIQKVFFAKSIFRMRRLGM